MMKKLTAIVFGVYLLSFCFLSSSLSWSETSPPSISYEFPARIQLINAQLQESNGTYVLQGRVKRRFYNSSLRNGHIDIQIQDKNARITHNLVTHFSPSLSLRRWRQGSSFHQVLPAETTIGSVVHLSWHKNQSVAVVND